MDVLIAKRDDDEMRVTRYNEAGYATGYLVINGDNFYIPMPLLSFFRNAGHGWTFLPAIEKAPLYIEPKGKEKS